MGTYNYSARELGDKIGELLNNLEGDFTPAELKKALRLVAVEHGVAADYRQARGVLHIEGLDAVKEIRKLRGG